MHCRVRLVGSRLVQFLKTGRVCKPEMSAQKPNELVLHCCISGWYDGEKKRGQME